MPKFKNGVDRVNTINAPNLQGIKGNPLLAQQKSPPKKNKIPLPGEGLSRIAHFNADQSGCGFWRMIWPSESLLVYNRAVVSTFYQMVVDPVFYRGITAIKLQRQCNEHQYKFVQHLRNISNKMKQVDGKGFKIIWEVDDVVCPINDIPEYNRCKEAFTNPQIQDTVKRIVSLCDEMTTVSPRMADHYKEHLSYDKISVIPNYFPRNWADRHYDPDKLMKNFSRAKSKKIRIGYAGSATHFDMANRTKQRDDFWHVIHDIIKYVDDYEFVFFGGYPLNLRPYVQDGRITHVPWGNLDRYPEILAGLDIQVMIAPLMKNSFSESKSNIKMLEASAVGIPCVCQRLNPYFESPHQFDTSSEMFDLINMITYDEQTYKFASDQSRKLIEKYWLDEHLDEHMLIYETPYGDPKRKNNKSFLNNNPKQFIVEEKEVYYV